MDNFKRMFGLGLVILSVVTLIISCISDVIVLAQQAYLATIMPNTLGLATLTGFFTGIIFFIGILLVNSGSKPKNPSSFRKTYDNGDIQTPPPAPKKDGK